MEAKEVAIVTAYIQAHNLLYAPFFDTVDSAYEIAEAFVEEYKNLLHDWDPNKMGVEYDEAIEIFVDKYIFKI